jgi:hypothetical protein
VINGNAQFSNSWSCKAKGVIREILYLIPSARQALSMKNTALSSYSERSIFRMGFDAAKIYMATNFGGVRSKYNQQ